jgi:hypothetical protein
MLRRIGTRIALALLCSLWFAQVSAAEQNAEQFVKEFYAWYFKSDTDKSVPEQSPDIYRYVAKGTVDRLRDDLKRGALPRDEGYFTKVQDYSAAEWGASIAVHQATALSEVVLVPVTFGTKNKIDVILFLKKVDGQWKIVKADDARAWP